MARNPYARMAWRLGGRVVPARGRERQEPIVEEDPCPMCGSTRGTVAVHGHLQCVSCGQNVEPCCGGSPVGDG